LSDHPEEYFINRLQYQRITCDTWFLDLVRSAWTLYKIEYDAHPPAGPSLPPVSVDEKSNKGVHHTHQGLRVRLPNSTSPYYRPNKRKNRCEKYITIVNVIMLCVD